MRLEVTIPVTTGAADDPSVIDAVHATIAQQATAWTEPVYLGEQDGHHRYATDAQPKTHPSVVTTSNIAPTLLPPTVA